MRCSPSADQGFEPSVYRASLEAIARHVRRVFAQAGREVIFQIETVACLAAISREPEEAQPDAADYIAPRLVELPNAAPTGTRFGVHLEGQAQLLALIEELSGRTVDVAAACGLGRRPDPGQAWDAMEKAVHLVTASL